MKKTLIVCVVVAGLLVSVPAYGFVAAYIQRAIMIVQQVTQIGKATEQIRQFNDKLDKMREQVDMVKDLKDSTLGELGALRDEFTSLVSKPTELVGDTMSWGSEFRGEAREAFDAARSFGRDARSLRESWRGKLSAADKVRESDILELYRNLSPEDSRKALESWRRQRQEADTQLVLDHTVADAAAALAKTLKDAQTSIDKLRNQTNKSEKALAQAQVTGIATQGEVLLSLAQLQAWQAARETAKSYQEEVERRRREAEHLAKEREHARETDKIYDEWKESGERLHELLMLNTYY
ncbi:MAG: hypothetical protein OXG96_09880 [Acidobacteria bacterium]|nr:hypothetical protein [Acidobacteriota bacterium]